jgi:hypothetical protein
MPLHVAIRCGRLQSASTLIDAKCDVTSELTPSRVHADMCKTQGCFVVARECVLILAYFFLLVPFLTLLILLPNLSFLPPFIMQFQTRKEFLQYKWRCNSQIFLCTNYFPNSTRLGTLAIFWTRGEYIRQTNCLCRREQERVRERERAESERQEGVCARDV